MPAARSGEKNVKRFDFRLKRVLGVRQARERTCEARLTVARSALSSAESAEQRTRDRERICRERLRAALGRPFLPDDGGWESEHMLVLRLLAASQRVEAGAAAREVARRQAELLMARRDRKMLEKIAEKLLAEHLHAANRQETREVEDTYRVRREVI